jgi:hypothetical protein
MPELDKGSKRRKRRGEAAASSRKADPHETTPTAKPERQPFHGALHSEHPQDPFRNLFGNSRLKFEF